MAGTQPSLYNFLGRSAGISRAEIGDPGALAEILDRSAAEWDACADFLNGGLVRAEESGRGAEYYEMAIRAARWRAHENRQEAARLRAAAEGKAVSA